MNDPGIAHYADASRYNLLRTMFGVVEGPAEVAGQDPIHMEMLDNGIIDVPKVSRHWPSLKKRIDGDEAEGKMLMSFLLLSKPGIGKNVKSIKAGDMFSVFRDVDEGFDKSIVGLDVKGDDEVPVGKVLSQQFNCGVVLIDTNILNSKPFTLMTIGQYEAIMWKSTYDKEMMDKLGREMEEDNQRLQKMYGANLRDLTQTPNSQPQPPPDQQQQKVQPKRKQTNRHK